MMRGSSGTGMWRSPEHRNGFQTVILIFLLGASRAIAQGGSDPPRPNAQTEPGMQATRIEFGGYQHWVNQGLGDWRGLNAELWLGRKSRFVSGFTFDSQTRPTGTQQNYAYTSFMHWTPSFYTSQSVSGAPQGSAISIYFPKIRYDVRANWKLPPEKRVILGAGFTHFDFGGPVEGEIYNLGSIYYRGKLVISGDLFINQSRPGDLTSASGSVSLQYGTEGKSWLGLTVSGGRELYRIELSSPLDARLSSYTVDLFYRRWIFRNVGYVVSATYLDKLDAYRRGGVSARLFVDF
jgi:YaiO family outer membrane protein